MRGVVATSSESGAQATRLVEPARQVLDRSCQLLEEARQAVLRPDEPDKQQRLAHVAKSVSAALNACINCLPGQKDVDDVIRTITESSQVWSIPFTSSVNSKHAICFKMRKRCLPPGI